jgi:hypothetical protein
MSEKKIDNVSPKNIYNTGLDKFVTRVALLPLPTGRRAGQ